GEAEFVFAAGKLAQRLLSTKRIGMRRANEAAGIIAFGFFRGRIAQARFVGIRAHAGSAGQECNVDAGLVHHPDMLIEIEKHPMHNDARRAMLVIAYELSPTEILRHQLARREMMLEVDNHTLPL